MEEFLNELISNLKEEIKESPHDKPDLLQAFALLLLTKSLINLCKTMCNTTNMPEYSLG